VKPSREAGDPSPLELAFAPGGWRLHQVCVVELAPHPSLLPLIGAARSHSVPRLHSQAIVLDFGHSQVKRGIAYLTSDGQLRRLRLLPSVAVPDFSLISDGSSTGVSAFFLDVVSATWRLAQSGAAGEQAWMDPGVVISLASYIAEGLPAQTRSLYAAIRRFQPTSLTAALRARTGVDLQVNFLHDGTAAARAVTASSREAVILLGTNLGVGLGIDVDTGLDSRLPLPRDFEVELDPRI
jgi:hypothetical protein